MEANKTTLERAFELAQSGRCHTIQEIAVRLRLEQYDPSQITGAHLVQQLKGLMDKSRRSPVGLSSDRFRTKFSSPAEPRCPPRLSRFDK